MDVQVLHIVILIALPCVALAGVTSRHATYSFDDDDDFDFEEPLPEIKSYKPWAKIIRVTHSDTNQPHKIYRIIQDDFSSVDKPTFYKITQLNAKPRTTHQPKPAPLQVVSHTYGKKKW